MTEIHDIYTQAKEAASYIQNQGVKKVEVGLILGSGLGELAN